MNRFCIIIPAVKKNVAFPDDLIKKLGGITLIERCIGKAKKIADNENIYVVTDSQEISLICQRNEINHFYKQTLRLKGVNIIKELLFFLVRINKKYKDIIILWPYTPLIDSEEIRSAYEFFSKDGYDILTTVKEEDHRIYRRGPTDLQAHFFGGDKKKLLTEVKAFLIIRSDLIRFDGNSSRLKIYPYMLNSDTVEIRNYQDWWICEKLLKRKRIIFRVIGYDEVGMGHIYRSLTLAHEITDHEIIFVCDEKSRMAVNRIAGSDYMVECVGKGEIEGKIVSLNSDMVINDMLNTDKSYILKLKNNGIKVVSFEDLGSGAKHTDLTINELFDSPQIEGKNIKWGHKFFFLRDEFNTAKHNKFRDKVGNLLITFGGTDPNNLTLKILKSVLNFCESANIHIYVVVGPGFLHKKEMANYLKENGSASIDFINTTGVMSAIMEMCQIAISSNGRTIYELVHMNIPSLVVAHHERERTHNFANENNGFVNLGVYDEEKTGSLVLENLRRIVYDTNYRKNLYDRMRQFSFVGNKEKVLKMILKLLD